MRRSTWTCSATAATRYSRRIAASARSSPTTDRAIERSSRRGSLPPSKPPPAHDGTRRSDCAPEALWLAASELGAVTQGGFVFGSVPRVGLEPTTNRLTAGRSTVASLYQSPLPTIRLAPASAP